MSKVVAIGTYSEWFECIDGVRQGEIISPFLFSLYLNDLEEFLLSNNVKDLSCLSEKVEREFNIYLQLFVLLYADDTILLSESPDDLQYLLDIFSTYCKEWHFKVNSKKTKVVLFGRGTNDRYF